MVEELCALIDFYYKPVAQRPLVSDHRGYHRFDNDTTRWLETTLPPEDEERLIDDNPRHLFYDIHDLSNSLIIPIVCGFGILGNTLNLIIFIRRIYQGFMERMEMSAIYGLVALATCDLLFCILTVVGAFIETETVIYTQKDIHFYYNIYGICLQSILIKTSIWLTVVIAIERYAVVCHPIRSRQYMKFRYTILAITLTYASWILFHLPMFWRHEIHKVSCHHKIFYIIDIGKLYVNSNNLGTAFTVFMITLGLVIPICILVFCNVSLLCALHHSSAVRSRGQAHSQSQLSCKRITITLILVIFMVIVFVGPSEVVHFYIYVVPSTQIESAATIWSLMTAETCTNILKSLNFSLNFVLYCIIHNYFRRTIAELFRKVMRINPKRSNLGRGLSVSNGTYRSHLLQSSPPPSQCNEETKL